LGINRAANLVLHPPRRIGRSGDRKTAWGGANNSAAPDHGAAE
jgi:hypothetical protein